MKTINLKMSSLTALLLLFVSMTLQAQDATSERKLVELHKEAFFDIRVTENSQASGVAAEVAQFIKTHDNAHVTVVGYADRQTGNPELNVGYARERAERFRNELIGRYGVDPACVTVDSKGDKVQPFSQNGQNRCVIIKGQGYEPQPSKQVAQQLADAQRNQYRQELEQRYAEERLRQGRDTIYISRVDTLWIGTEPDSLREEHPFRCGRKNRWNNWFISVEGGPSIFQGDHNIDAEWKDRIYPAFTANFGKWIVPAIGVRAGVDLDVMHNIYNPGPGQLVHHAEPYKADGRGLYRMHYNAWDFHADVMFNISSLIWRPYQRRIWNIIPYAGVGCIATWDDDANGDWFNSSLCWNVGLLNSFRVSEHIDINLDVRLKEFSDEFNSFKQGKKNEGLTNVMIGLTWNVGKRGF